MNCPTINVSDLLTSVVNELSENVHDKESAMKQIKEGYKKIDTIDKGVNEVAKALSTAKAEKQITVEKYNEMVQELALERQRKVGPIMAFQRTTAEKYGINLVELTKVVETKVIDTTVKGAGFLGKLLHTPFQIAKRSAMEFHKNANNPTL